MNRFRLLLITTFVVAVTAFSSGISVSYAEQASTDAKPAVAKDAAATNQTSRAAAAARATAKKAEMLKKRDASKKYIQKVVEGQQNQSETGADNAEKGVAK